LAIRVAQTLLVDHPSIESSGETSFRVVVGSITGMCLSFDAVDLAQLTSRYLHKKGIRVWR